MSQIQALRNSKDLYDLARILGYKAQTLSYIVYAIPPSKRYTSFTIKKKSGGDRKIKSPAPELKLLQSKVSNLLQDCIEELKQVHRIDACSHGFTRGKSIISNATNHRKKKYVVNIDINDFFGSINFGRVRGYFIHDKNFSLDPKVATIIAQIACHNNSLPQGSPCSPVISNLISRSLDMKLLNLAKQQNCWYTRYADDITFSTNTTQLPPAIAKFDSDNKPIVGNRLNKTIISSGFSINTLKTRIQLKGSRQEVTGLVTNKRVNVPREYRKQVRAIAHNLMTTGVCYFEKPDLNASYLNTKKLTNKIQGMLGFIDYIDKEHNKKSAHESKNTSQENLFKRFLIFKEFYSTENPVIICEGKTDKTYLLEAEKNLHPPSKHVHKNIVKLKIYSPQNKRSCELMGLLGGTSPLLSFMKDYVSYCKSYSSMIAKQPVIIIIDSDSGASKIFSYIKCYKKLKENPSSITDFFHLTANLYIVPVPNTNQKNDTTIEDLFTQETLETKLSGKKLSLLNTDFDTSKYYGKAHFAEHVVKANANKIDFSGFDILFKNIYKAINHYHETIGS